MPDDRGFNYGGMAGGTAGVSLPLLSLLESLRNDREIRRRILNAPELTNDELALIAEPFDIGVQGMSSRKKFDKGIVGALQSGSMLAGGNPFYHGYMHGPNVETVFPVEGGHIPDFRAPSVIHSGGTAAFKDLSDQQILGMLRGTLGEDQAGKLTGKLGLPSIGETVRSLNQATADEVLRQGGPRRRFNISNWLDSVSRQRRTSEAIKAVQKFYADNPDTFWRRVTAGKPGRNSLMNAVVQAQLVDADKPHILLEAAKDLTDAQKRKIRDILPAEMGKTYSFSEALGAATRRAFLPSWFPAFRGGSPLARLCGVDGRHCASLPAAALEAAGLSSGSLSANKILPADLIGNPNLSVKGISNKAEILRQLGRARLGRIGLGLGAAGVLGGGLYAGGTMLQRMLSRAPDVGEEPDLLRRAASWLQERAGSAFGP